MSQSSPSMDSRKRKETADPTTSAESPQFSHAKRRRTKLSLKRNNSNGWSSSFVNNNSQDEDSQSAATLSFSSTTVSEKNERNYQLYASKYGIQLKTAKKYYKILAVEPIVVLNKAVPIKKELSPIPFNEDIRTSPILSSKKRLKRPKIKIKKENITPTKKDLSKKESENIAECFESLPAVKIKEEVLSPSESEKYDSGKEFQILSQKDQKDLNHFNLLEKEFKNTKKLKSTKNLVNSEKNRSLVTNPFSKNKSKDTLKISSEMSRSKNANDKITKKKKKRKLFLENEVIDAAPTDDSDDEPKKINTKEKAKKLNTTKNKQTKLTEGKVETGTEIESINSLSVNCQSLFGRANINVKRTSTVTSANCREESPVRFGARSSKEANDDINIDQSTSSAENNIQSDKVNGNALNSSVENNNTDDESHNLNSSFISLGISGSPIKSDDKSPIEKVVIRCSTPQNKCNNDIIKSKVMPKIISDKIIGKCPQKSVIPCLSLGQKSLLKSRPNSPIVFSKPSKLEKLSSSSSEVICMDDSLVPFTNTNEMVKKVIDSKLALPSKTSMLDGGVTKSVPVEEINSVKTVSQKGGKQQTHRLLTVASVEESFDSLCKDVCQLSSNENITLYKGEQNEDNSVKNRQTFLSSKRHHLHNDPTEVETSTHGSTKISPLEFQRSPRLKFKLKKNINRRSASPVSSIVEQQQQHQNQARASQGTMIDSLEVGNTDPRQNSFVSRTSVVNVNEPRLNGSFSALDPRLRRSSSPTKAPVIKDPRLLSGNSQPRTSIPSISLIESAEKGDSARETIVDPRLRKRKEREEAELAAKMVKEDIDETNDSGIFIFPQNCQSTQRRSLVCNRLGASVSPEKELKPEKDVIQNIVKDARSISPTKSTTSDNDDNISLFAGDTFSSDEESNASPRHRKFTSERLRVEEIRNQPLRDSLKDRLGWSNSAIHRKPTPTPVFTPVSRPPRTAGEPLNTSRPARNTIKLLNTSMPLRTPIQSNPQKTSINMSTVGKEKITFNEFGNNDSEFNENFFKMNATQMQKDVANLSSQQDSESNVYVTFDSNCANQFDQKSMLDGPHPQAATSVAEQNKVKHFFTKYCFKMLKTGKCSLHEADRCHFVHQIQVLKCLLQKKSEKEIIQILDYAFDVNYDHFISFIWESILPILQDTAFFIFQKLYYKDVVLIDKFLLKLLDYCISSKLHTVESFVKRISPIVRVGDSNMVRSICVAIKGKLADGFCWEAIKDLCQKAVPPRDMIELTLIQCLKRKKSKAHIMEVNDLITRKMTPAEREVLSTEMVIKFDSLVRSLNPLVAEKDLSSTLPMKNESVVNSNRDQRSIPRGSLARSESIECAQSFEQEKTLIASSTAGTSAAKVKRKVISLSSISTNGSNSPSVMQPHNSPLQPGASTPKTGETFNFSEYSLQELAADEPKSIYRERFWKLYATLHCVNEGLAHLDYEYAWKVMDEFSKQEGSDVVKNAYYHLLCKNVRSSEKHMSEIIKQAVRGSWSTTRQSFDVLFDVGVSALINLANSDLWVMALQLLSWVKILEPEEPKTAFVLISAEIYIANNDPLEALYLLQKTRLIRTNRDEWLVKDSSRSDEKHRNKIVFILLKALSFTDPEKATYLFKAIMADQYNAHYPIDLPLYLDKLTLLLLIYKKEELVSEVCRIVMDNDLTFQKETYQELLRYMLGYDEVLANQLLDYAIHLGYYSDIQIRDGYTTLIINTNSCEEELYLIFKRLIRKLVLSIGPAIDRMKKSKLKVFLMFEDVPNEQRLYRNDNALVTFHKYKVIKNIVTSVLTTRFNPPIKLAHSKVQKCCKIVSRTLVDYLMFGPEHQR